MKKLLLFFLSLTVLFSVEAQDVQTEGERIETQDIEIAACNAGEAPEPAEEVKEAERGGTLQLAAIDIEVPDHELVSYYKKQYLTDSAKKWLSGVMNSASQYRAYIIKELKDQGLPLCLQYLPVIESNYKISALSKSGAAGLWQFMKNSISPFNIRMNDWMDERRDPWLSTSAALKKLKENYAYFNDWYLALASYNAGLGAVSRTIKTAGKKDFWYLAEKGLLKNETKQYVPKFLAIAEILENHEYYGIEFSEPDLENDSSVRYEELVVNQAIALDLLAQKASLDQKMLSFYNPALYYGVTPLDSSYRLRLPQGSLESVKSLIQDDAFSLMRYSMYTVKSGDTLYALSLHYGINVSLIQQVNGMTTSKIIIGQKILIPSFKEVAEYKGRKADETLTFDGSYIVQKSDTLWSIALAYDIQVEQLAEENNMSINDILRTGSSLKVPILD